MNDGDPMNHSKVCPVKLTIALAAVLISVLALIVPDVPVNAWPFAAVNGATVFLTPTFQRRCRHRCWIKTAAIFSLIVFCIMFIATVPDSARHSISLLCIACGLANCLPMTSFLADRRHYGQAH